MKTLALLIVVSLMFSSCSEDTVTPSTDSKPFLEVSPTAITAMQYEPITIKYRVASFAYDDQVNIRFDFGNGDTLKQIQPLYNSTTYFYKQAGNYTLTLTATDSFTDTVIATKSIPVTISTFQPTVSLAPVGLDTTFAQKDGAYFRVVFSPTSNLKDVPLKYSWTVTGNGVNSTEQTYGTYSAKFPTTGTYTVLLHMKDYETEEQLAADSTTVTIRLK